jgi:serine/threonine-protein kinase
MGPRGGKFVLKFEAGTFPGEDQLLAQSMRARLHAGIARLFGRVVINGVHCKVMEFVPGRTLRAWVQVEGYFDPITAVWLIKQAAEALACLHDMGMVHNDVKEENFMVTEEGQLKLIDPGLVAPLPCAWQCGTPEYKSPEKLNGATFDQRADIFSLGIVYYWMTKGLHPYDLTGDPTFNMQSVRANMQTGTLRPDIVDYPADIQGFIRRLVHVDPAQRFQSCEEVIAAADGILRRHSPSGGSGGN